MSSSYIECSLTKWESELSLLPSLKQTKYWIWQHERDTFNSEKRKKKDSYSQKRKALSNIQVNWKTDSLGYKSGRLLINNKNNIGLVVIIKHLSAKQFTVLHAISYWGLTSMILCKYSNFSSFYRWDDGAQTE